MLRLNRRKLNARKLRERALKGLPIPAISGSNRRLPANTIGRTPSPFWMQFVPWTSVILFSMTPILPIIASAPVVPPLGFMALLAWRMLRPGLFPVWAGLPLGFVDDLYSGQPMGSAILLWSVMMLAMEVVDLRYLWRSFMEDWLCASVMISGLLFIAAGVSGVASGSLPSLILIPQLILSILTFPLMTRIVAWLDGVRLRKLRAG